MQDFVNMLMNPTSYNKPASSTIPDTDEDREALLFDQIRSDESGPANDHNVEITMFKDNQKTSSSSDERYPSSDADEQTSYNDDVINFTSQPFALSTLDDIKNTPQLVKLSTNHHQKINRMMSDQDKAFRKEYSQIRGIKTYKIMPKSLQPKQKQMETLNDIDDEAKQQLKTHMKIAFDQLYLAKVSEIKHYKKQLYHLVESKIKDEKARLKHIASREMEELSKRNEERRVERKKKLPVSPHKALTQSNKGQIYKEHQEECDRVNRLLHEKQTSRASDMASGHQRMLKDLHTEMTQLQLDAEQEYSKNCNDIDIILQERLSALNNN